MFHMSECFNSNTHTHKLTSLKVSPYVLLMYLRKVVVHCKVVTLSVSESQNGTSMFSSSQHKRILFLNSSTDNADVFSDDDVSNFTDLL